jgi:WD40 repeat protein
VKFWDVTARPPRPTLISRDNDGAVLGVAFAPDGLALVCGGGGAGDLRLCGWDGRRPSDRALLAGHRHAVHALAFAPDGTALISAGHDGRLVFWETATGRKRREWELRVPLFGVAFAGDGRHLATANGNGTVYLFRLAPPPSNGP